VGQFEQRYSDEQVEAAREKIAAGLLSLRAAAAEIGCAPSTLSVRIRKAEAAEADARLRVGAGRPPREGARGAAEAVALAAGVEGKVGPIEALRGALQATRANGQPDWPTRVSAAKALASLRPEELEPETEEQWREASIVVYDLPPGAPPVLHRARKEAEAAAGDAEAPSEPLPTSPSDHWFFYQPADGESVSIGTWSPDRSQLPDGVGVTVRIHTTEDAETAERWRVELSAGRLAESTPENGR
jgi:hypothetical protein